MFRGGKKYASVLPWPTHLSPTTSPECTWQGMGGTSSSPAAQRKQNITRELHEQSQDYLDLAAWPNYVLPSIWQTVLDSTMPVTHQNCLASGYICCYNISNLSDHDLLLLSVS